MTETAGRSPGAWVQTLAAVGSPVAFTTALLFYFGWVRTRFQADVLGYDPAILDFGVRDYLLKSVNVVFLPVVGLLLVLLFLHEQHRRLVAAADGDPRRRRRLLRAGRLAARSWRVSVPVVAVLLVVAPPASPAVPFALTAAVTVAVYGHLLRRRLEDAEPWSAARAALTVLILALALFWSTERVARATGEAYGRDILADPRQLVAVTVFSAERMELTGGGVTEEALGADSAYRYRYDGLRLLERSGDRLVLLTESADRVVLLRESEQLRFEFAGRDRLSRR